MGLWFILWPCSLVLSGYKHPFVGDTADEVPGFQQMLIPSLTSLDCRVDYLYEARAPGFFVLFLHETLGKYLIPLCLSFPILKGINISCIRDLLESPHY